MAVRILSGIIGVVLLVAILVFLPPVATQIAVAVIAAMAFYEFSKANFTEEGSLKHKLSVVIIGYIIGFLLLLAEGDQTFAVSTLGLMLMLSMTVFFHKNITFSDAAKAYLGAVYIFAFLKFVSLVRLHEEGIFLVFAIFVGAFITDTGAYFAGFFFGKNKLSPEISPKKTIEGSVGGVVLTCLVFEAYVYLGFKLFEYTPNYINALVVAAVLSVVSQVGDLCASVIKRELGIKDYGNIMPGHGGALDRFDSVLFVAPAFYYLNLLLPIFVIK